MQAYVVTAGEYSDYHIEGVFLDKGEIVPWLLGSMDVGVRVIDPETGESPVFQFLGHPLIVKIERFPPEQPVVIEANGDVLFRQRVMYTRANGKVSDEIVCHEFSVETYEIGGGRVE